MTRLGEDILKKKIHEIVRAINLNCLRIFWRELAVVGILVFAMLFLLYEWNKTSYVKFDICTADVCPEVGMPVYLGERAISKIKSIHRVGKWDIVAFRADLQGACGSAFFEIGPLGKRLVLDANGRKTCSDTIRGVHYLMIKDASIVSAVIGKFRDLSRMYSACVVSYKSRHGEVCDATNDYCAEFALRQPEYVENVALNSRSKDSIYVNFAVQRLVDKGESALVNENVPSHSSQMNLRNVHVPFAKVFPVNSCNDLVTQSEQMEIFPAFDYCVTLSSIICNFSRSKCAVVANFYANADNRNTYVLDVSKCGNAYCAGEKRLVSRETQIHYFDCKSWRKCYGYSLGYGLYSASWRP